MLHQKVAHFYHHLFIYFYQQVSLKKKTQQKKNTDSDYQKNVCENQIQ